MDQGGQRRDQVDATVVPNVRRQRGAAPASCTRLQPRQFLADAGDAPADQGLVTDESEGKADQDRREGGEPRPLCYLPDGRGRHRTANVPGDFAAHRGTAAAATTSASMRRSTVMRSRATDGMSASECQGKRPDQAVKYRSDGRECREPSTLSHLGFQPVQKTPTIHVSSGFIWGIPVMKTKGHAGGARRVEGTGITDLRPLADSLDTNARQIHSTAEIIRVQLEVLEARSIEEESAEQSTEAKAAENTAPCSPHDGQQHPTSTSPAVGWRPLPTLDRTPVIEAHAAPIVDTISPEAIYQRISGALKAAEVRAIEWMPDRLCAMEQNSVRATSTGANAAEPVERRAGTKGNAHQQSTHWTQNQARVSQALERIRQAIAVIHPRWEKLWGGRRRLWHLHRPHELMEAAPCCKSMISAEAWPRLIRSRPWWWSLR